MVKVFQEARRELRQRLAVEGECTLHSGHNPHHLRG
jgi:hypothetical protein